MEQPRTEVCEERGEGLIRNALPSPSWHRVRPAERHRTCFVRAEDNFWYYCDDAAQPERQSSVTAVLGREAYMLLYERR